MAGTAMYKFPHQLAKSVTNNWETLVEGPEYDRPTLPTPSLLKRLLEVCYLVSLETDEGRSLRLTICCVADGDIVRRHNSSESVESLRFDNDRNFNVEEVRRLATTTDVDSSALWVSHSLRKKPGLRIRGLINQGTSWASARRTFSYWYVSPPSALIIRVLGPGRLSVYQGIYLIASLSSGLIQETSTISTLDYFGIHEFLENGIDGLSTLVEGAEQHLPTMEPERYESLKDRYEFEWIAYLNTVLSIVNVIQSKGHGGTLILTQEDADLLSSQNYIKPKYRIASNNDLLQKSFTEFIRLRNNIAELQCKREIEPEGISDDMLFAAGSRTRESFQSLVEAATFIGNLAGADGAIVLTNTFKILGFSAEITAERAAKSKIYAAGDWLQRNVKPLDVEQFGMRHRSAIKLCSNTADAIVFVVSQDGDVSLIWKKDKDVMVKRGVKITNANMVLA